MFQLNRNHVQLVENFKLTPLTVQQYISAGTILAETPGDKNSDFKSIQSLNVTNIHTSEQVKLNKSV